jgi:hypothetical protein
MAININRLKAQFADSKHARSDTTAFFFLPRLAGPGHEKLAE